ncbi:MAG: PepSY domain-containing protein [Clostridiales bacterium]|jgi:uncharacterized membrane protein YkoI|nr:PepSY domain-containing protein [Clostridiales bacterium]
MSNQAGTKSAFKVLKIVLAVIGVIVIAIAAYVITTFAITDTSVARQDQIMAIAEARAPGGRATTPELDWEGFRWLWRVEVWEDRIVHEIYIHPRTDQIMRHEMDRD